MPEAVVYDTEILDLLVAWEDRQAAGQPVALEDLCCSCPQHINTLRQYIERLTTIQPLLARSQPQPIELTELPGYDLLGELGRGGMGVVYRAFDRRLKRTVAVKIPFLLNGNARLRFEREGATLAQLKHPNITPVHSAGTHHDIPYIVLDLIPGVNLREHMPTQSAPVTATLAWLLPVVDALACAHEAGIVHRDVKPSNILLDANNKPYVCDFGVAALQAGDSVARLGDCSTYETLSDLTELTQADIIIGTPAYAAPEMQQRRRIQPNPTVDVWSLGVILYECFTGQLPYPNLAAAPEERFAAPLVPAAQLRRGLPRTLDAIIQRCLARDPQQRYPHARALANDLTRWLRQWRRRRLLKRSAVVGLGLLLCATITTAVAWPKSAASQYHDIAERHRHTLRQQAAVELLGATGAPASYLVRTARESAKIGVEQDNFAVETTRPCFIELLPDVPLARYAITAEAQQWSGLYDARLGIYFAHHEADDGHHLVYLSIGDLGPEAYSYTNRQQVAGGALHLRGFHYRAPDPPQGAWNQNMLGWSWYPTPIVTDRQPPPWRTLRLEVDPNQLRGVLDQGLTVSITRRFMDMNIVGANYPQGGLGLYAHSCKGLFRNVRIEPLP